MPDMLKILEEMRLLTQTSPSHRSTTVCPFDE